MTVWRQIINYVPVNLANILVSFGGIFILTRLLDASEYGRYALALVTMQLVHTLFFTWMEAAMERYHARASAKGDLPGHLKTLFQIAGLLAVATFALFMTALYVIPISAPMKTIMAFALMSTCLQTVMRIGFEAHKAADRITRYSILSSGQMLLGFTIGILLIMLTPLREAGPFIGLIVANAVVLIFDLPFYLKRMKGGSFDKSAVKPFMIYGLPICFSLILELALSSSDRYVIGIMLSEADVGRYSAGYGLANRSIDVLFIWIGLAVTPHLVRVLEHDGLQRCLSELKSYGATLLLVTMPAAVGLGLTAEPMSYLLGEPVREAGAQIIPWIVGAGVANGMISYYVQRAFMLGGKTILLPVAMIAPMALNLGLNIWLLPIYGIMGAVYATVISYAFGLIFAIWVARKYFPLPLPFKAFGKISLACAAMIAAVLALPLPGNMNPWLEVLIKAGVGAPIYIGLVIAMNAADCRDLLSDLLQKLKSRLSEARHA